MSAYTYVKPTRYAGIEFRSRLEARWAVFFDALGIGWEYEPETFDLGDGLQYTPDFRVDVTPIPDARLWEYDNPRPEPKVYVEVKPTADALLQAEARIALSVEYQGPCAAGLIILSDVPNIHRAPVDGHVLHPVLTWHKGTQLGLGKFTNLGDFEDVTLDMDEACDRRLPGAAFDLMKVAAYSAEPMCPEVAAAYDAARDERFGLGGARR